MMPGPEVTGTARRRMSVLLVIVAAIVVAYWILWFTHRSLVAADTRPAYREFENAFPLADGWLVLLLLGAADALRRQRSSALGWLLAGAGAGVYLFCMDVWYDLQHGIWAKGVGGAVELVINLATVVLSAGVLRWSWRRRAALLAGVPAARS